MVDLLTYTYQNLVSKIKQFNPPRNQKIQLLIDESCLEELIKKESELVAIASEIGNRVEDATILFKAKYFLLILGSEKVTVPQATKAIAFLSDLKAAVPELDTNSAVEDFISTIDLTLATAKIDEMLQWYALIKTIPTALGKYDSFIPMIINKIKSLIWNIIPADSMESNLELVEMLNKCIIHKDLNLSDVIETVISHCVDFIEGVNDFYGIEAKQGNPVKCVASGTSRLLDILIKFNIVNEELKIRLRELVDKYTVEETKENVLKPN